MTTSINNAYEKACIGHLLRYYRIKSHLTMKEFVYDSSTSSMICSTKTLSKIEKGIPLKDDYYYDYFCAKLHMQNKLDDIIIQQFADYADLLYHALCHLSLSQMETLLKKIKTAFIHDQHVIYFRELHMLYHDILVYHLYDRQPDKEHVLLFYEMRSFVNEKNKKLLLYFLYTISNVQHNLINKSIIEQECMPYHLDPLFLNIRLAHISKQPLFVALQEMKKLNHSVQVQTNYQKIVLYNMTAFILLNMNEMGHAYQFMQKSLDIIQLTHDYPSSLLINIHVRCAIISFAQGQYNTALKHFSTYFPSHSQNINYNYLLLFHLLEKTNRLSSLHKLLHTCILSEFKNPLVHKIFYYYRLKHQHVPISKSTRAELEEFIIYDLIDLARLGDLYYHILLDELLDHITISRCYKNCALFLDQLYES